MTNVSRVIPASSNSPFPFSSTTTFPLSLQSPTYSTQQPGKLESQLSDLLRKENLDLEKEKHLKGETDEDESAGIPPIIPAQARGNTTNSTYTTSSDTDDSASSFTDSSHFDMEMTATDPKNTVIEMPPWMKQSTRL